MLLDDSEKLTYPHLANRALEVLLALYLRLRLAHLGFFALGEFGVCDALLGGLCLFNIIVSLVYDLLHICFSPVE